MNFDIIYRNYRAKNAKKHRNAARLCLQQIQLPVLYCFNIVFCKKYFTLKFLYNFVKIFCDYLVIFL